MQKVTLWSAGRSGAAVTVVGKDEAGADIRVTGVHTIEARDGKVIATDLNGEDFELVVDLPAADPVPADDLSMGNG